MVGFQTRTDITKDLDSVAYCCASLPCPSFYSSLRLSHRMRSFAHSGVARLHPNISTYHTRSSATRASPVSVPSSLLSALFPRCSPDSYCVAISPRCLLLAFRKISAKFDISCFSAASCCHRATLLCTPPLHPFSPAHTSKIDRNASHCAMATCVIRRKFLVFMSVLNNIVS